MHHLNRHVSYYFRNVCFLSSLLLVFFACGEDSAVQIVSQSLSARISHIVILSPKESNGSAKRLLDRLHSLMPSVLSERMQSLRPIYIVVMTEKNEDDNGCCRDRRTCVAMPGVDYLFRVPAGEEAKAAQEISNVFTSDIPSSSTSVTISVRELGNARPSRNAMVDPWWIGDLVGKVYKTIDQEHANPVMLNLVEQIDDRLRAYVDDWGFYAPSLSRSELLAVIMLIFERFELFDILNVDREVFRQFVVVIEANYCENPYHNFRHGVDVLQCCYHVLNTSLMLRRMFKPIDIFALFVAALCHDVGHGSFNNAFLMEHESLIAWLYNDHSVLENMHSTVLFAILRNPSFNFAKDWSRSQWKEFRSLVVASILGTDMSRHFEYIRQFGGVDGVFARSLNLLNSGEGILPGGQRRLIAIAIIKFADICNVVRPWENARRWGFHLMCEFFHQGDWEKILGYQSTPMTARSISDLSKGQQYFLNNVAAPLYRCVSEFFSEFYFVEEQLKTNLEQWRVWKPESDDLVHQYAELYPFDRQDRLHSH